MEETKALFEKLIVCGNCGDRYMLKKSHDKLVWRCRTFIYKGKDLCDNKQIPNDILVNLTKEVLNLSSLAGVDLAKYLTKIEILENNVVLFHLLDGNNVKKDWSYASRKDSWTKEMKEAAKNRELNRMDEIKEKQIEIKEEQLAEILNYIKKNGRITRKEVEELLGTYEDRAYKLLVALQDAKKIYKHDDSINTYYNFDNSIDKLDKDVVLDYIKENGQITKSKLTELITCTKYKALFILQELKNEGLIYMHSKGNKTYYDFNKNE